MRVYRVRRSRVVVCRQASIVGTVTDRCGAGDSDTCLSLSTGSLSTGRVAEAISRRGPPRGRGVGAAVAAEGFFPPPPDGFARHAAVQ